MMKRRAPRPPVADEAAAQASRGRGLEPAVLVARGFSPLPSVETKDFNKAAEGCPRLREERKRLLATYTPSEIAALANALIASVREARRKGQAARRKGPRDIPVSEAAEAAAKQWAYRVKAAREQSGRRSHAACVTKNRGISKVMARGLSGASETARRERASKLIDLYADAPPPATRRRRAERRG